MISRSKKNLVGIKKLEKQQRCKSEAHLREVRSLCAKGVVHETDSGKGNPKDRRYSAHTDCVDDKSCHDVCGRWRA
jgi:NAD-dependent dihydropyrimidine dehydrogenase PreA subunit